MKTEIEKLREMYLFKLLTIFYGTNDESIFKSKIGSYLWTVNIENLKINCKELDFEYQLGSIFEIENSINTFLMDHFKKPMKLWNDQVK